MGTKWAEIISDYAMLIINDIRLQDEAAENPAEFMRKMSIYTSYGMSLLEEPPELLPYLEAGLTEPDYDDFYWTSTDESVSQTETVVHTGLIGYSLFSCGIRSVDAAQNVHYVPYTLASYDAETGDVTFPQQSESGVEYQLDFYIDGEFASELSRSIKKLLGKAVAVGWDERFTNTWINKQPKIHDKSFDVGNESNYIRASSESHGKMYAELCEAMNKYSQNCAYMQVVPVSNKQTVFR